MGSFILFQLVFLFCISSMAEEVSNYDKALAFEGEYILQTSSKTPDGENDCNETMKVTVMDIGIQTHNLISEVYKLYKEGRARSPQFKIEDKQCVDTENLLADVEICNYFSQRSAKSIKKQTMRGAAALGYLYEIDELRWQLNALDTLIVSHDEGLHPWSRGSVADYFCVYKKKYDF